MLNTIITDKIVMIKITLGAPKELFCKIAVLQWAFFAGKTDPVLCLAGKMKYICWETFSKNFLLHGHYRRKAAKILF